MDSKASGAGPRKFWADQERKAQAACGACSLSSSLSTSLSPCRSLNHQKNLVELSFLPGDTGKPDVFPASLGLLLLKPEERRIEAEVDREGEEERKKNQKRKEKRSQKGQEEAQLSSKKKEPQKPQAKKQGKRLRLESGSGQVRPSGRVASPLVKSRALQNSARQRPSLLLD